mmetsp:Transcript_21276/g.32893  ORF Transcript_21276/g.32893 Transcript_21276/m.32893 type:complete len:128 (-) Transcript_21276:184-567(-)
MRSGTRPLHFEKPANFIDVQLPAVRCDIEKKRKSLTMPTDLLRATEPTVRDRNIQVIEGEEGGGSGCREDASEKGVSRATSSGGGKKNATPSLDFRMTKADRSDATFFSSTIAPLIFFLFFRAHVDR